MSSVEADSGLSFDERQPYSGNLRTLDDLSFTGETVLLRGDLDVKTNTSTSGQLRLDALRETVDYILEHDARRIILLGHRGRPEEPDYDLSTERLVVPLKNALGQHVQFFRDSARIPSSRVSVFENLRFFKGEKAGGPAFADLLSGMGTVYVNDAFANSHRDDTSMVALAERKAQRAAGRRVVKEVDELEKVLGRSKNRFISLIGGAKIETKLLVVNRLSKLSELVLIGGKMPTEIAAQNLALPTNTGVAQPDRTGTDINGASAALFAYILKNEADTIIWNGPMGLILPKQLRENGDGETTTREIATAIADSGAYSVVGGGDTLSYLEELGILDRFTFTSMGGGAMLDFISGKPLRALEVLRK